LLMAYWALNLPALGQEIAMLARQYPSQRNVTLRLLEPLGAPEDEQADGTANRRSDLSLKIPPAMTPPSPSHHPITLGVALGFEDVSVRASGHLILDSLDLRIEAGEHVAIVGPSGAGKSSFVGLLLGWHRATEGRVMVDGEELRGERLARLRRETAWVDPAVQLWNRPLIDNLRYGSDEEAMVYFSSVIEAARLRGVLEKLPEGMQTVLGEGGGLVSGGEGQRVRFGRALMKAGARLVILDESFRGLDRAERRALLKQARELWHGATLLCITHDVGETLGFDRVLVVDKDRIVEDAPAMDLASRHDSLYRTLLEAEEAMRAEMWMSDQWRRLRLSGGRLLEEEAAPLVRPVPVY
ncbi:MAG TPA: ABC transporter ATP-binding protein, partial [Blastocatellia bacterium]|nr:ABC transporter ATP-binding protein [Blastocatellia bacterium]